MTEESVSPTSAPASIEVTLLRADGEKLIGEMQAVPFVEGQRKAVMTAVRDMSERRLNEELRLLLAREVDHRARNALAVAQSLVKLTRAPTQEAYVQAVEGRIRALAMAHSLLSQNKWRGGDLAHILDDALSVFSKPGQVQMGGPSVTLLPNTVQPMSLVIHELATNAFKHGALQAEQGRLQISWQTGPEGLTITWVEAGGPVVQLPSTVGFGSTLLNEVITRQLEGQFDLDWRADGLRVTLRLPLTAFRTERGTQTDGVGREAAEGAVSSLTHEGRRVLVVEDDSLIAMELVTALQDMGWSIAGPVHSLRQGLSLLQQDEHIDVAILDVNLAGLSVFPLAEALQARGVPFVFCSGYDVVDAENRFLDVPVLQKPIDMAVLERELAEILAAGAA
jgi:two-component sensor histidine kinase